MAKIDVNKVAEVLQKNQVEPDQLRQIIEDINSLVEPDVDPDKPPPVKKQWCILISDPENKLADVSDLVGWVMQIPETESVMTTQERIIKSAYEFNTTKRGRLKPVETIGEALEHVPAKHFKESQVWIKTMEPVLMLRTDNEIPLEKTDRDARRGKAD